MSFWIKYISLAFVSAILLACSAAGRNAAQDVHYLGRYELTDAGEHRMGWPGSGIALRFRGTKLSVTITDDGNGIMDAVINGAQSSLSLSPGTKDYTIVTSKQSALFDVSLTRRTEVFDTGLFVINDIKAQGDLVPYERPSRKILFLGDSITAGFGVRGNTKDCQYTPASNAPLKSYAWLAAQALKAEPHLVAISGRGVVYNYDDNPAPVMPVQIDYAVPDKASVWDHAKFPADAVVVALGTNDWSVIDPGQDKFNAGYAALLRDIRARFPQAQIIAVSGPLLSGAQAEAVQQGIDFAIAELADPKISALNLKLSETQLKWSCNAHPGRDSMAKMANDLSAHISGLTGWAAASVRMPNDLKISPPDAMLGGGKVHYKKRVSEIAQRPPMEGGVLFLGDSITEGANWSELFPNVKSSNHGIGWDTVAGVGGRLPQVILNSPDKIFIKIGTNDIGYDNAPLHMASELEDVIKVLRHYRPNTRIYIQSVLPREVENAERVAAINSAYKQLAEDTQLPFVDLTKPFSAADGSLRAELTDDKLHLNAAGYKVWAAAIEPYVME